MSELAHFYGCSFELGRDQDRSEYMNNLGAVFEILKPKPSPRPLIRIGSGVDGAYLIPDDLEGLEACFSPGVSNRKDFEDHLSMTFGIKCHMCDFSSDKEKLRTPLINGMQTFKKAWLDVDHSEDNIRLDQWIKELSPDVHDDLLLQMDIEGAEYRNLLSCPIDVLARFRIVVLELHGLRNGMQNRDILQQVLLPFFRKIDELFVSVHVHPNNAGGEFVISELGANMPDFLELTYLRKNRLSTTTGSEPLRPMIPHPLDIPRNVRERPPLFLNEVWVDGNRPLPSRVKMLEDELAYQKYKATYFPTVLNELIEASVTLTLRASAENNRFVSVCNVKADEDLAEVEEIATGRTYVLSSSYGSGGLSDIVPDYEPNFFFHTDFGLNQSISIDLGRTRVVRLVTIKNRRDACFDRARLLFLVLDNEQTKDNGAVFFVKLPPGFLTKTGVEARIPVPSIRARYVTVVSPLQTALHFSSLRVFAKTGG